MWKKAAFCGFEKKSVDKKAKLWKLFYLKSKGWIKSTEKSTDFFQNCANLSAKSAFSRLFCPNRRQNAGGRPKQNGRKSEVWDWKKAV
ncbi:hypothetical protein V6667_06370 [Neisseria leonii]|uniref:Uncharacterized protein n=1 Tax=Neisseria leonii TaxID=2995413 RepID=A0A9X4IE00_9NEIS|nr:MULTISPECIES: hypothetical protein [unclassified Neisseria]MDD9324720.1 hypothetical protein [Neisseria sp. 3986]MDD9327717.1 hypothetical protein [Neisseria sp. 51.81]